MHVSFCEALNSALGIMHGGMDCDKLSNLSHTLVAPICSELYTTKNLMQKTEQKSAETETAEVQWKKKTY